MAPQTIKEKIKQKGKSEVTGKRYRGIEVYGYRV
jgi:hypothetical protein